MVELRGITLRPDLKSATGAVKCGAGAGTAESNVVSRK